MVILFVYLTTLFIAPQLWVAPLLGWRTDLLVYPAWVVAVLLSKERNPLRLTPQDKLFLLMLLWIVASIVANGFHDESVDLVVKYVKWFILYKLVASTVASAERLKTVALMLIGFALLLAVEGIQHIASESGLGWAGQPLGWIEAGAGAAGRTRWINIFDGPGVFCVVFTVALPFLLHYLTRPFGWGVRLLGAVSLGLLVVAIYFTGSRGGFLTALGVFGLFMAIRYNLSTVRIAFAGAVILVVFSAAPSYLTTMQDQSNSAKHRVEMWAEGVEMVQQNPVLGIGKGNFLRYTSKLIAHNSAVEIMGETGLPGLFFWIGLLYLGLKKVALYARETDDDSNRSYAIALGLSVVGYIISSMFVTLEYETLYFLIGLCASVGFRLKEPLPFTRRDVWIVAAITLGWVVGIKAFVMVYTG
jgi:O-antigen ligase